MPTRILEHQLQALREAFIAMLPYVLFSVIILLINQLISLQGGQSFTWLIPHLHQLAVFLQQAFPLILCLSISLHSANMFGISRVMALITTFLVLLSYQSLITDAINLSLANLPPLAALLSALVSVHCLRWTYVRSRIDSRYMLMSGEALRIFHYLGPTILASFFALLCMLILHQIGLYIEHLVRIDLSGLPTTLLLAGKTLISHIFWLFGIHGDHLFRLLFDSQFLQLAYDHNFSYKNFYDIFVNYGGSGASLSLVLALLLNQSNKRFKRLAWLSAPFSIFNISEILIYGLPIVFNRYLIIPFVAVPMINIGLATVFIPLLDISFQAHQLPWITPIFINAYFATGGDLSALMLQAGLLTISTAIYWPFVRALGKRHQTPENITNFYRKLNMLDHLENHEKLQFWRQHEVINQQRSDAFEAFELIQNNHLDLHYQPIVDPHNMQCHKLECLLRLETKQGYIPPNQVLDALEATNLATTVDFWVVQQIGWQLASLASDSRMKVTINLHPQTILNDSAITHLLTHLHGLPVAFEILERGQASRTELNKNIQRLRQAGFEVGIDDFGTGYSNLASLQLDNIDFIKLDQSFMRGATQSANGKRLLCNIANIVHDLNINLIIEGIETKQQHELAKQVNAQWVQGWYYSAALPWHDALHYAEIDTETISESTPQKKP